MLVHRDMPARDQQVILRFMEMTIEKVNNCLANIYAIERVLIDKGLVTDQEMLGMIEDAKQLPERLIGMDALSAMIDDFNKRRADNGQKNP